MSDYALELNENEILRYHLMAAVARKEEAEDWTRAGVVPGARVTDVGCGPGAVLALLADIVGPDGAAVGVDNDPAAAARAHHEVAERRQASVVVGGAEATGLEPARFDVVMCRHVLAHNGGREAAIVHHLGSLLRPGGAAYLVDVDLTGIRTVPDLDDLDESFDMVDRYIAFHTARGGDVKVGMRLGVLLDEAGLEVERYRCVGSVVRMPPGLRPAAWAAREAMVAEGAATAADIERWEAAFTRLDQSPFRPWFFVPVFIAIGRRPG